MKSPLAARSALPAAAALAVLALLAGCADASDSPEPAGSASESSASESTAGDASEESAGPVSTEDWRTEVWHDVQVQVPADWAVGYAPITEGNDVLECAVGPLGSDSRPDTSTPYVGRPGYGSDVCDGTGDIDVPSQDFVWFDSPLDRGEDEESGRTVTTVDIGAERVTVGAAPDVAKAILTSLGEVGQDDNGCPAQPKRETRYPAEGFGHNLALSVCVYASDDPRKGATAQRVWTDRLDAEEADQLVRGVALSRRADCDPSAERSSGQTVLLRVEVGNDFGSKTLIRDYQVQLGACPVVLDLSESVIGTPRPVALNERILDAWATDGVRAYVGAGLVRGDLASYFKAPQG